MCVGKGGPDMLYIGIDLGTSAVKLLLMDGAGQIKKIVSKEYPIYFPHPAVIPEKGRADHVVCLVQDDESMHLPAKADACHLLFVTAIQQFLQPVHGPRKPVFRLLF